MLPPSPFQPHTAADRLARRHRLAQLSLAWLANMQVMMFAFPGYFLHQPMGADNRALLEQAVYAMNWVSLTLTVPVILYCAWPVWNGAWRRMQGGGISMDVPVALGIVAAFLPSAYATWVGRGEVYFESVTMFVAFLLTARYLEHQARYGKTPVQTAQQAASGATFGAEVETLRANVSALAQRLAFWFVVVQLALAAIVGVFWLAYHPAQALPVTVALLVMSCPCAMAMAVPTALSAAQACLRRHPPLAPGAVRDLARATHRVTRQNLYGAIVWHLLMTPLAAAGLVQPWLAAIVMLLSSLAVAANSWCLYRRFAVHRHRPPRTQTAGGLAQELPCSR